MLGLLGGACFLLAWYGTRVWRAHALAHHVIDAPNARSSHRVPTPRGGGGAIVIAYLLALCIWYFWTKGSAHLVAAMVPGGLLVAGVGFWDDHRPLPPSLRLVVHLLAAGWAVWQTGNWSVIDLGVARIEMGWPGFILETLALTWSINLYNFMDGIDGLAGGEGVFLGGAGAGLMILSAADPAPYLLLGLACAGFLMLNWPPAKIFMGDVGSGFLGFAFGVLILHGGTITGAVWPWLILSGAFVIDATFTLVRRAQQGLRVTDAHRTHAYQWATRRAGSHKPVTISILTINVVLLLPGALLAWRYPVWGVVWLGLAWLPLLWLAWWMKAGVPEASIDD